MDNRTVQRALQGDQEAARAVEDQLRSAARQLLSHPSLRVDDPVTQRVLANAAVAEALERELRAMDTLLAAAVMAAARRGVEHLRRLQGSERGAGHLPPGILVSVALVPQILASASRNAAEQHLSSCAECTEQARSVRDAAASATFDEEEDDDPEEITAQHHIDAALDGTRQVAFLGGPEHPGRYSGGAEDKSDSSSAAEAMLQRLLETADAVEAARDGGDKAAKRRRLRRRKRGERPMRVLPLAVLAVALVLIISRMDHGCGGELAAPTIDPALAELAEGELPPFPAPRDVAPALEPAFEELALGDCAMGANRFRLARMRDPALVQAWTWEALAALCAGRGDQAVEAFDRVAELEPELRDLGWYQAQAALTAGRVELAERRLRAVCGGTSARVQQACAQLARIEEPAD